MLTTKPRKGSGEVFADSEWIVTAQLEVKGQPHGDPITLHYADSYLAKLPDEVGRLIASRMQERALQLKKKRKR